MKALKISTLFLLVGLMAACSGSKYGSKVKDPYGDLQSTKKFWRGGGKGDSKDQTIAKGKADLNAKADLAGQVNTTMKQVTDQYLSQNENEGGFDLADKFQSLIRQVMNTEIADLRKLGEKTFYSDETDRYTVFIGYEIKKKAMLKFMKKQVKLENAADKPERELMEKIIDAEILRLEQEEGAD